jgi:hypothetical protein
MRVVVLLNKVKLGCSLWESSCHAPSFAVAVTSGALVASCVILGIAPG